MLLRADRYVWVLFLLVMLAHPVFAEVQKSPNDTRQYKALTLDNALKVLLISDPSTDKAAASMDVEVGSSANPRDRAGLAHFLEHMLFLGTEKYPTADEYQAFIQANGGSHNAFTAQENTNYFFDVKAPSLEPALDRFAQFFIAPLFNATYVDRERHAVDSEYQAKIRDDGRRVYAAGKKALNPDHSYSQFSVGSLETLADRPGDAVRDDLIDFYQTHYSANRMALVVLGKEPLDTLEQMVRSKFSAVPNRELPELDETVPLFRPDQLPAQLNVKTLKEVQGMTLTFPMPETRSLWRQKPLSYISDLIGYEGDGSLLSLLKQQGWATSLAASPGHDLPHQASFITMIELTPSGFSHRKEVVQLFFDYIELMNKQGVQAALYDEMRQLSQIAFQFRENGEPIHEVSRLAQQLQRYPADEVISANYRFEQFDAQQIEHFLSYIRPDNMLLTLSAPDIKTDQVEAHYQTPYQLRPVSQTEIETYAEPGIAAELSIRPINPYVATDLSLKPTALASSQPERILSEPNLDLWYQLDADFRLPKANLYFSVKSPVANASVENWLKTTLYTELLSDRLNETLYDALLAGLGTEIYPHLTGFSVRLTGYNDKLGLLLNTLATELTRDQIDPERFARLKRQMQQQLENRRKDKPYNQTNSRLIEMLLPQWPTETQLTVLAQLKAEDIEAFIPQLFAQPQIRILAHGNVTPADAKQYASTLQQAIKLPEQAISIESPQIVQVPTEQRLTETLQIDHNDAAVSLYLQAPDLSVQSRARVVLLNEILSAPFYSELRTEKQFGYIVFATPLQLRDSAGIGFIVQSPNTGPTKLVQSIDAFLEHWQSALGTLSDDELKAFKASVRSRILQQENTLAERSQRYWRELDLSEAEFDRREALAVEVAKLTPQNLQQALTTLRSRTLLVQSFGQQEIPPDGAGNQASQSMQSRRNAGIFVKDAD